MAQIAEDDGGVAERTHHRAAHDKGLSDLTDRFIRGQPFSPKGGTCSEGLTQNLRKVEAIIETLSLGNSTRRDELIRGLMNTSDFQRLARAPVEYRLLANGISIKWAELSQRCVRATLVGRIASRVLAEAITCGIPAEDSAAHDSRISRPCAVIGIRDCTLWRARKRVENLTLFARLDPTRATRKDALQGQELENVLLAWEMFTRPEPCVNVVVRMRVGPAEYVDHAVHWQEHSTESIWEQMIDAFGPRSEKISFGRFPRGLGARMVKQNTCPKLSKIYQAKIELERARIGFGWQFVPP